jgi:hypothetical protein
VETVARPRIGDVAPNALAIGKARLRLIAALQMTWPGMAGIYYGDEVGLTGHDDPDDRRPYPWGAEDTQLRDAYRSLAQLRATHDALRTGDLTFLLADDDASTLAYGRRTDGEAAITVLNLGDAAQTVEVGLGGWVPAPGDPAAVERIGIAGEPTFRDQDVRSGGTYHYVVAATDTSFNRSQPSTAIDVGAESRQVAVTFTVSVPASTPSDAAVYIAGDFQGWDPAATPMQRVDATTWSISLPFAEGTPVQYKYVRQTWDAVEKDDGCGEIPNRELTVQFGTDGSMAVADTVAKWRDVDACGWAYSGDMGWLGGDPELNTDRNGDTIVVDDGEIVELDGAEPRPTPRAILEVAYIRDRRDPTSMAGIWRALEGL